MMRQVVAALILKDGKVLISQRTQHQPMPLKWEFPGGKLATGEHPEAALKRELDEDLGIEAVIGQEVAQVRHQYRSGGIVELRFYEVHEFEGELENKIFKEIRWASLGDLPSYDFLEADFGLVRDLAAGKVL